MSIPYEVTIENDNDVSATLVIQYTMENTSILCGLNITVHEITRKYGVDPSKISTINVTKQNDDRKVEIKYMK